MHFNSIELFETLAVSSLIILEILSSEVTILYTLFIIIIFYPGTQFPGNEKNMLIIIVVIILSGTGLPG